MATQVIRAVLIVLGIASFTCDAATPTRKHYTPVQYLKNYALSACVAEGYQSPEVVKDAGAAANGYKELGSLDIDAYNDVAALIPQFLSKTYKGQSGEPLIMMKCTDFFYSPELDRIARKYAKRQ
jgi:hypothetical protein